MPYINIIQILDSFIWLLVCIIPFLIGILLLSCWVRNTLEQAQHDLIEHVMVQQLEKFTASGHWPKAETDTQRKAMKQLAKRFDIQEDLLNAFTPPWVTNTTS